MRNANIDIMLESVFNNYLKFKNPFKKFFLVPNFLVSFLFFNKVSDCKFII